MSPSNEQKTLFDPNARTASPLRSLTGMVMDKLNFNICSSYVERQIEFEMNQGHDMTAQYGVLEMKQHLFDEGSVVESMTSRASEPFPEKYTV
mmetsp:Transcript_29747/g.71635  ORF Transcript_29747/g.71635 Transcript_29747/m.71635 type:complete len:93 (-) Transcript_29747:266-544(-)|eukprot:CAMPEP_0113631140 /NCGR_PEP_ID=MMETSP0017_2-20120614/16183_1 /TAXON_ID=2856 /ORGANISM="Cylindrotheca closterium" /LENGTH=92 /DNA_ID=CAMNT_0000541639 /DNA_START=63 /DNA_END=341 /DNA_ORIENTATION=- /assembly_acc=CAM_ASM_000147